MESIADPNEILSGKDAAHAIVINPQTGKPWQRPGRVGDLRRVEFDLTARSFAGIDHVATALDMLYEDFQQVSDDQARRRLGEPLRTTSGATVRIAHIGHPADDIMRPVAAWHDGDRVSIIAEIDEQAHRMHRRTGNRLFGDVVVSEPDIPSLVGLRTGATLDRMADEAQTRLISSRTLREVIALSHRRSRERKIGLTAAIVGLVFAIAIGSSFLGSLLVIALSACLAAILIYSKSDTRWAPVERLVSATRNVVPNGRRQPPSLWSQIEETVADHAPSDLASLQESRIMIERLDDIAAQSASPDIHARIAQVKGGLDALMDAYRKPASFAIASERVQLASDLSASIGRLALEAEEVRKDALGAARSEFDCQRRYIETRQDQILLSPMV